MSKVNGELKAIRLKSQFEDLFNADKVEIINSFTGKTVCNKYSRLTKQSMFRRFGRITNFLPGIANRTIERDYAEEKSAAIDYQVSAFKRLNLES